MSCVPVAQGWEIISRHHTLSDSSRCPLLFSNRYLSRGGRYCHGISAEFVIIASGKFQRDRVRSDSDGYKKQSNRKS
ncbi:hypothetical protein SH528x_005318 [Novipirellula sp. SH528]|uniref:hypothetical protein n=1 Tax=Novipirellula sp. SH528 TaxID=3454466 RepID=UPI003FA0DBC1